MRPRQLLRLIALLPAIGVGCDKGPAHVADVRLDGGAEDASAAVTKDGPPDGNPLGSAKACDPFRPGDPPVTPDWSDITGKP